MRRDDLFTHPGRDDPDGPLVVLRELEAVDPVQVGVTVDHTVSRVDSGKKGAGA
jgi:hypothetical protein